MCRYIFHIGRDKTQNKISVMAGNFVLVYRLGQFCQRYPPISGFIMLFDHQNQGIDTSYVEIYVTSVKK